MRIVQFEVDMEDYTIFILMEDGRMFYCRRVLYLEQEGVANPRWSAIELPEHPMGMPKEPLGRPLEERVDCGRDV